MRVHWKNQLMSPETPGNYSVTGLGNVRVLQEEIDLAARYDGNCFFEIVNTTTNDNAPQFILGHVIPA